MKLPQIKTLTKLYIRRAPYLFDQKLVYSKKQRLVKKLNKILQVTNRWDSKWTPIRSIMLRRRQMWRWRWNRKNNDSWKRFRFLNTYRLGSKPVRVYNSYKNKKIWLNFFMWKYSISKKNLLIVMKQLIKQDVSQTISNQLIKSLAGRWDSLLYLLGLTRNVAVSRSLINKKQVLINGKQLLTVDGSFNVGDSFHISGQRLAHLNQKKLNNLVKFIEFSSIIKTGIIISSLDMNVLFHKDPHMMRFLTSASVIDNSV